MRRSGQGSLPGLNSDMSQSSDDNTCHQGVLEPQLPVAEVTGIQVGLTWMSGWRVICDLSRECWLVEVVLFVILSCQQNQQQNDLGGSFNWDYCLSGYRDQGTVHQV